VADRREEGLAAFAKQFGMAKHDVLPFMREHFGEALAEEAVLAAGAAWSADSPLTMRERSLVVLTALAVQGVDRRLRPHVRLALENGLTRRELEALGAFLAVYAGYPRASVALEAIRDELTRLNR
jgi:4-carboxymuconolactone decarboxylase